MFPDCNEEWYWDEKSLHGTMEMSKNRKSVKFLKSSNETVAIIGDRLLGKGSIYYWELVFDKVIYGTDTMVGVGTKSTKTSCKEYCSLLGRDKNSWGYSYRGYLLHNGIKQATKRNFFKNDVIGLLLDTWHGTLKFFINGEDSGLSFNNVISADGLYPMVSSTAAGCIVRLKYCADMCNGLEQRALMELSKSSSGIDQILSVPGLTFMIKRNMWFIEKMHLEHLFMWNVHSNLINDQQLEQLLQGSLEVTALTSL